jgi:hypothetical protein
MMKDVTITLAPVDARFDVRFDRRTRKTFRDELVLLGGRPANDSSFKDFPMSYLERVKETIAEAYPSWDIEICDHRARTKREGDRIKWANIYYRSGYGSYSHHYGYVGRRQVFEVHRTTSRYEDHPFYLSWELESPLNIKGMTTEEVEVKAEGVLKKYLDQLGVTFKD